MASELHTNLILNDTRFTQGLERADRGVNGFLGRMGKSVGDMNKIMKLAGLVQIGQNVVNKFDEMHAAQVRMATGAETFRDKWAQNQGLLYEIGGYVPILGDLFQKIWYAADGGPMQEAADTARNGLRQLNDEMRYQIKLLEATTEEEKQLIQIREDARRLTDRIGDFGDLDPTGNTIDEIGNANKILRIKEAQLQKTVEEARVKAKSDADHAAAAEAEDRRRHEQDQVRSGTDFSERIFAEDTAIMRAKGFEQEAARRDIEAERRRMIREVWSDPTVEPWSDEVRRRSDEVNRIAKEKLELLNSKPADDPFDRSVVGSGLSPTTMGQLFGPGLNTAQDAAKKQAEAAAKQTQETKKQTEVLQQIARNTSRGLRYG